MLLIERTLTLSIIQAMVIPYNLVFPVNSASSVRLLILKEAKTLESGDPITNGNQRRPHPE